MSDNTVVNLMEYKRERSNNAIYLYTMNFNPSSPNELSERIQPYEVIHETPKTYVYTDENGEREKTIRKALIGRLHGSFRKGRYFVWNTSLKETDEMKALVHDFIEAKFAEEQFQTERTFKRLDMKLKMMKTILQST